MQRFYRIVCGAIFGLILFWGFAPPMSAQDNCLREVLPQSIEVYASFTEPLTFDFKINQGKGLGPIPDAKLTGQKTALVDDLALDLTLDNPKGRLTVKKPLEVQKKTGEKYRLLEGTTVEYELPTANYRVTLPKGTKLTGTAAQSYVLNQDIAATITPPANYQVTLKVDPKTRIARVPGAGGTGTTLQVQPSQAPPGAYVTLIVTKDGFDFTKAQFHVCLKKPGENEPFIASDDVELKEVKMGTAKLQARIPSIIGVSGIPLAEPVDLLVEARGPDDKLAEVLSKEFKISSRGLAFFCWLLAFFLPWLFAAIVTKKTSGKKEWRFNPIGFVSGKDGGASLSLAQILVWTILVFSASFYVLVASGKLLALTSDVLILLGIAGGASVIAKIADSAKNEKGLAIAAPAPKEPKWLDLLQTDGQADLYKFQMALFTVLAAVFVAGKIFTTQEFPVLPAGLLTLIGISNGVYLTAKGAGKTAYQKLAEKSNELNKAKEELAKAPTDPEKTIASQKVNSLQTEYKKLLTAARN